ncbi:hypothetical protein B5P43_35810 [Bacillus sp. SRB_336]|nr:hypothetical protein B5P43_35810 [Bacillus sp. SRB_336]
MIGAPKTLEETSRTWTSTGTLRLSWRSRPANPRRRSRPFSGTWTWRGAARIARELHDVVSHGLTVVVLQTLAARTLVSDLPGEELRTVHRHLDSVEEAARDALADMRRMLGLLETTPALPRDARPEPVPQLRDLAELGNRARKAGLAVDDSGVDAGVQLPVALELTGYRIVQEALTNAIKYAPGSRVTVRVSVRGASLHIEVADDGGPSPAGPVTDTAPKGSSGGSLGVGGRGLLGMRERVAAYGGRLEAGPLEPGGFRVRAELALDASASRAPSSFLGRGAS